MDEINGVTFPEQGELSFSEKTMLETSRRCGSLFSIRKTETLIQIAGKVFSQGRIPGCQSYIDATE
jgi:hypothetical protein